MNELKLTQVIFIFFLFNCVAANVSDFFCMAYEANNERFLHHFNLSFKYKILYTCKLAQPELIKINSRSEGVFSLGNG